MSREAVWLRLGSNLYGHAFESYRIGAVRQRALCGAWIFDGPHNEFHHRCARCVAAVESKEVKTRDGDQLEEQRSLPLSSKPRGV